MENVAVTMKEDNLSLKKNALSAIRQILNTQYGVSGDQACQMIEDSGIEILFDRNAEMAAHTSYRTWAQRVYEQSQMYDTAAHPLAQPQLAGIASPLKISSEKRA